MKRTIFGMALVAVVGGASAQMAFLPDTNGDQILRFRVSDGQYLGPIGAGFLNGTLVGSPEQNPSDGYLYVPQRFSAATNNAGVLRFDPYTGTYAGILGNGLLNNPTDIAFGANGTMYVADQTSGGDWAILRFNPTTGAYGGILALGFLGNGSAPTSIHAIGNTIYAAFGSGTSGAVARFDGVTGTYQGLLANGFVTNPLGITALENGTLVVGSNAIEALARFETPTGTYKGLVAPGWADVYEGVARYNEKDLIVRVQTYGGSGEAIFRFDGVTATYKGLFANGFNTAGFGLAVEQKACITGTLDLGSWDAGPRNVNWELLDGGGNVVDSGVLTAQPEGAFQVCTYLKGNFSLRLKASHWLARAQGPFTIDRDGANAPSVFLLKNGDVNGDNEVGAADFSELAAAYDAVDGDANFNPEADLNGDGEVGAADFSILAANYDEVGD